MDIASLCLFAAAVVLLVALFVHFLLWVKVRYEHRAFMAESKGVISAASEKANRAEEAAAKALARVEEVHAAAVARAAELAATNTETRLKHEALDESVAALNAKTAARERAAAAEAKRAAKGRGAARGDSEEGDPAEGSPDISQGDLLAALAEQQARGARTVPPTRNNSGKLIVRR